MTNALPTDQCQRTQTTPRQHNIWKRRQSRGRFCSTRIELGVGRPRRNGTAAWRTDGGRVKSVHIAAKIHDPVYFQAGYSSVGRASDCRCLQQSDGPWFDSGWPDIWAWLILCFVICRCARTPVDEANGDRSNAQVRGGTPDRTTARISTFETQDRPVSIVGSRWIHRHSTLATSGVGLCTSAAPPPPRGGREGGREGGSRRLEGGEREREIKRERER